MAGAVDDISLRPLGERAGEHQVGGHRLAAPGLPSDHGEVVDVRGVERIEKRAYDVERVGSQVRFGQ